MLELGCGTGRILIPLARAGVAMTGLDRSKTMLSRARGRGARLSRRQRPALVLGDVGHLPFANGAFSVVLAPYGLLQSLLTDRALNHTLAEAARVLRPGGLFGIDLVPDLRSWKEYDSRVRLKGTGPRGSKVTLVESVRQDRRRGLTIFEEEFIEAGAGRPRRRRFTLTFRTRPVPWMIERLHRAGFSRCETFGDYTGGPIGEQSEAWLILGRKK